MGNQDGLLKSLGAFGKNDTIDIDKENYFSFAYGNEIALVVNRKFYILNCDGELWEEVFKKVKKSRDLKRIKKWWKEKSKKYEISDWSNKFEDLK